MHRSLPSPVRTLSSMIVLSFCGAFACYTPRQVGDSRDKDTFEVSGGSPYGYGAGGGPYSDGGGPYGYGGLSLRWGVGGASYSDCEPSDARATYEAWNNAANEFGEFAGTSWLVEETPAVLVVDNDVAYLQNGDYVAPFFGRGYLEPQMPVSAYGTPFPWVEGGRYELHGVKQDDQGVFFGELPTAAAHGDWCRMQRPYPVPDAPACNFDSYPGPAHLPSCTAASEPVDCWWLRVNQSGVCECDFQGCFPNVRREYTVYELQISFLSANEASMLLLGPKQEPSDPSPDPLPIGPTIQYRLVRH